MAQGEPWFGYSNTTHTIRLDNASTWDRGSSSDYSSGSIRMNPGTIHDGGAVTISYGHNPISDIEAEDDLAWLKRRVGEIESFSRI